MAQHSPLMLLMIAELDKRGILYEERDATIVCPSLKIKLHPDPVNPNSDVKIYVIDSWRYLSCYLGLFHGIDCIVPTKVTTKSKLKRLYKNISRV